MGKKQMVLKNSAARMRIGVCRMSGRPALYVEENNRRRIYAEFLTPEKAEDFIRQLERWDENGGSDEKYTE